MYTTVSSVLDIGQGGAKSDIKTDTCSTQAAAISVLWGEGGVAHSL